MAMTMEQKKRAAEKRAEKKAEQEAASEARQEALQASFAAECKNGIFTDDPVWNPRHSLYSVVNELIRQGLSSTEAVEQATKNGDAIVAEQNEAAQALEDLATWLEGQTWSEFAQSLAAQYRTKGSLSPKQEQAAYSMREKVEAKRAEKAKAEQQTQSGKGLDLSGLRSGYYAVPNGETRLKVRVAHGKPGTKWDGWTFVSDGAVYGQRTNYGSQRPGGFYSGKIVSQLEAIMADPQEAMKEYGRLTGTCGNCGRKLEDENSVAAGIGPICAQGW